MQETCHAFASWGEVFERYKKFFGAIFGIFLNFFFSKKCDKKKCLKFYIRFLFVFKRFSPNTLKDIIAFFVPNSCASAQSARSSMCKRVPFGPNPTAARFAEGVQFCSVFGRL